MTVGGTLLAGWSKRMDSGRSYGWKKLGLLGVIKKAAVAGVREQRAEGC